MVRESVMHEGFCPVIGILFSLELRLLHSAPPLCVLCLGATSKNQSTPVLIHLTVKTCEDTTAVIRHFQTWTPSLYLEDLNRMQHGPRDPSDRLGLKVFPAPVASAQRHGFEAKVDSFMLAVADVAWCHCALHRSCLCCVLGNISERQLLLAC